MWSLRWVLLVLGAVLVLGVYLWGRGVLRRPGASTKPARVEPNARFEPELFDTEVEPAAELAADLAEPVLADEGEPSASTPEETEPAALDAERVVTLRLVPKSAESWNARTVVLALRAAGMKHGRYGIFHRFPETGTDEPLFSVANLTEPGSFDLTALAETELPGMSFFLVLPGIGDPVERFDMMVETARSLARELDGELHDDRGSSWSIQRERYVREQIIDYRYQLERS